MAKQLTRMEVDGMVVEIKPIDREVHHGWADGTVSYRQRSLYELLVDGQRRGYLQFPLGWGGNWELYSLRPRESRWDPRFHKHDEGARTEYGIQGYYREMSPGALNETENWGEHRRRWDDRNDILAHVPKMVALGRLPTAPEVEAQIAQWKLDFEAREEQDRLDRIRREEERAERTRLAAIAAEEAEALRIETLEALQSIRDQFGQQMTNLQGMALSRAIERWERK